MPAPCQLSNTAWRRLFLAVIGGALLLRLAVSIQLYGCYSPVVRPSPATDMYTYQEFARQLLEGRYDWSQGFYYQPLYYAVFLPAVYATFGTGAGGVILVQTLLGTATVVLVALAFTRLFGRLAGLLAALLLALCRMHVFYTPVALMEVLQGFWLALLLWLSLWAQARPAWWRWALAGLVLGLGNLTRGNMVLLAPALLGLLLYAHWRQGRRLALALLVLAATFYLPQLPFALVNYHALGHWVGPSSAATAVLALGNTPEAPPGGREPGSGAGPMEYPQSYDRWVAQDRLTGPDRVSLAANVARWLRREPLAYPELKFRMLLLFWNRAEVPNNVALEQAHAWLLHLPVLLGFLPIGGLGLAGLAWALWRQRRQPGVLFAGALVLIYSFSIVLFYVLDRFRVPVLPLFCGFAGYALAELFRIVREYREQQAAYPARRALLNFSVLLAASMALVGGGYDCYRLVGEAPVMRLVRPHGVQVDLGDRWLLMDNGPFSFGGWAPGESPPALARVKKTFVFPPEWAGIPSRAILRLPLLGDPGRTVRVWLGERDLGTYPVPPPAPIVDAQRWLAVELPPEALPALAQARQVTLTVSGPIIVDTQRHYGRTTMDGVAAAGELVAHLELAKPAP